jgi:hypothetical protein
MLHSFALPSRTFKGEPSQIDLVVHLPSDETLFASSTDSESEVLLGIAA